MGENFLRCYREKMKKEWKIAFWSAFCICILVHIYKFTNTLLNHDTLYNIYSQQNIVGSGRWFLQYACGISSYFDLPWVNGLLSTAYLSVTAVLITELFDLKNPVVIVLSGAVLVASPCTTETFFFGYTADGYMMGLLFSALAAALSCKGIKLWHWMLSGTLLCLATGIYQAYISFAVILCVAYLVLALLNDNMTIHNAWRWIGRHLLIYSIALASYYAIWKVALHLSNLTAVDYQGIDSVGKIGISTLIHGAMDSFLNLYHFFLERNILKYPITPYSLLNVIFLISFAGVLVFALIKSKAVKQFSELLLILMAIVACVPLISIWEFTSDSVEYRPMMLHSVLGLYILALILFDQWVKPRYSTIFGLFMAIVVFNFAIVANVSYFYLDKSYEKSYYMASQVMEEIEETTYSGSQKVESVAFIGNRGEEVNISWMPPADRIMILSRHLESDLIFDGEHTYLFLKEKFGLDIPQASAEVCEMLAENSTVQEMPVWPAKDAVALVDHTIVVKLGE